MVTLQLRQIRIPPGQRVEFQDVSWREFEKILEELGEHRGTRVAYSKGTLEIVAPLPWHEVSKELISDMVKILLDALEIDNECFGSTTFKREEMKHGIEPDNCFYTHNYVQMIGKERIDLSVDPPPDLAIEVDLTSKTQLSAYEALGVAELWRYENRRLRIDVLQMEKYVEVDSSLTFPGLPIIEVISACVERGRVIGRSRALREFRQWVADQLSS